MKEIVHYITSREGKSTKLACEPSIVDDDPRFYKVDRCFVRMDGRRGAIDELLVTCSACKDTDEYKRSAHWNEKIRSETVDTNLTPMNKRKVTLYEAAAEPPRAEEDPGQENSGSTP